MQTELSEKKILSMLKTVPGVQAVLKSAQEKEALKASRADDVKAYLELNKAKREADRRRDVESAKTRKKIIDCLDALDRAKKEAKEVENQFTAHQQEFEKRRGELENRLQKSAPQEFIDRLNAIKAEIDELTKTRFTSTTAHLDGRITNPEMDAAKKRMEELFIERDQINQRILEEVGENDE